ncbi:MAG: glycerol-3-phosphate 1-O-acyltransferase PlsY [Candidatus Zapsychrus exili]|nr:glycerol-3-phosphate 1-O-acyltransferase PlsY [Candidatus Zapsychrus exili]
MIVFNIILSYLIGSIPSAYIFGKMYKNIDIRQHGSGNIGATNVFRVLGKGPGSIVLLLDIFKGVFVVALIPDILGIPQVIMRIIAAIFVVIGHNWTCFLQFKGGKGVATSLGVLIGLTIKVSTIRPVLGLTLLTWITIFLITRFVSFSSIIAAISLPIYMLLTDQPFQIELLGVAFCVFVVIRHKANIKRLLAKEEPRVPLHFRRKRGQNPSKS